MAILLRSRSVSRSLWQSLGSDTEFQSALVRLAIAGLVAVYLGWATATGYHSIQLGTYVAFFILYMGFVLAVLISIVLVPGVPWRPYLAIFADTMAANTSVLLTGVTHSPLFLTYIWIIVTQGTRYGRAKLRVAAALSLAGYCAVLAITDEFRNSTLEALIQIAALIALPLYLNSMLQSLNRARREAEVANQAKSDFLAHMTHEIRTPLNGVVGTARVLESTSLDRKQRHLVEALNVSARSLRALIDNVLDFAKIEAGKLDIVVRPLNVRQVVRESVLTLEAETKQKGLRVSCQIDDNVPGAVIGDENRIREVLLNLLSNALKFTEAGEILTEASCIERPDPDHAVLRFAVTDTGIGIPADKLDELFESFTQLESSAGRRYGGTGLGTTIARDLVQLMGGKLEVNSVLGQGTTFWFDLELELCSPAQTDTELAHGSELAEASWKGKRVLVGEDDPISARVVQEFLGRLGCESDVAPDGAEVLLRLAAGGYHMVLLDMRMPVTDGVSAARQWRAIESKNKSGNRLPIIALTANATTQDQKACLSAGMDGFLTKPVEPEALARVLEDWFGSGSIRPD